jgi:hypothetical protein
MKRGWRKRKRTEGVWRGMGMHGVEMKREFDEPTLKYTFAGNTQV